MRAACKLRLHAELAGRLLLLAAALLLRPASGGDPGPSGSPVLDEAAVMSRLRQFAHDFGLVTAGMHWGGWDPGDRTHYCQWHHVRCDDSQHVTIIQMINDVNFLGGPEANRLGNITLLPLPRAVVLPPELAQLRHLEALELVVYGYAEQMPPEWGQPGAFSSLTRLVLDVLGYTSPAPLPPIEAGALQALQVMELDATQQHSPLLLPPSWGRPGVFRELQTLTIKAPVALPLPAAWSLRHNNLTGPLPTRLACNLPNLASLELAENQFTGTLPPEWALCQSGLTGVHLASNQLTGPAFPAAWVAPNTSLSLIHLSLSHNRGLTGTLPAALPWNNLQILLLRNTSVSGSVPEQWCTAQFTRELRRLDFIGSNLSLALPPCAAQAMPELTLELAHHLNSKLTSIRSAGSGSGSQGSSGADGGSTFTSAQRWGLESDSLRMDASDLQFIAEDDGGLVQLGEGAHGVVYLAKWQDLYVGVKVLELQPGMGSQAFWHEIALLKRCTHPRIVPVYGVAIQSQLLMVAVQLMIGGSLRAALMNPEHQQELRWAARGRQVALDVAEALVYLHEDARILHSDVKSGNVLLSQDWRAALSDFGVAQVLAGSARTAAGGSNLYAAPEQLLGRRCTLAADMYSFGLLLVELLTRRVIIRRGDWELPRPGIDCPQEVANLIDRCLFIVAKAAMSCSGRPASRWSWLDGPAVRQRRRHVAAAAASPLEQQQLQQTGQQQAAEQPPSRFEELMQHARLTHIAQDLWGQVLRQGDVCVDATCGNGHDTAFLAKAVGPGGTVHAFDVQPAAIEATQQAVADSVPEAQAPALHMHLRSHAEMRDVVVEGSARVVVFNLGYLPGSDKATTTREDSTLAAVQAACQVLQPGGLCSILCYTGHPGGMEEYEAVKAAVGALPPSSWVSSEVRLLNRPTAPVLLLVWKRA
ncbi:S-adenosyl-L-methionine-dependent methyltransferase domain-containing [Chlorella sorokiniana]|uniref:S-adenosyl-L-methionine-dependent methyltransferase domain-containing n=1 Tax=Chlorella sorokiniana TaxID=3076 RepID=A0A2P6TR72_CHLSO|nr:S-adenosyl-L-methionine-dependent methyltransferase domain-containing [Chlorella sorokiniana]|eukprot:PRW56560.1 S-adenosyl-L-methionine-dependent methyltransferase domain-containing [Chlorella sorokiniana]